MSGGIDTKAESDKLPYTRPKIVSIDLLADEVLAVSCKTVTGGNPLPGIACENSGCEFQNGS